MMPHDIDEKNPVILPYNDYFVSLVIKDCHEMVLHAGVNNTLLQTRGKFWIIKCRRFVRSVVNCLKFVKGLKLNQQTRVWAIYL